MSARPLALVTGGTGYFGSVLLRKLVAQGVPCRNFDLHESQDDSITIEFVRGDIRDYEAIARACRDVTVVYHNVAQVPLAKDRALFKSVNVHGTENLLRAALSANVQKVVYTSSSAVYGAPRENPVTEATEFRPAEPYGRAKLEGERVCQRFSQQGLDVSIIRPRTILGHGRLGIFQILFEWIYDGINVPVLGSGDNLYQFVHADDLAEACILAAARPGGSSYNCGAEQFGTMRQALEHLCKYADTGSRVKSVPFTAAVWAMKVSGRLGLSPLGEYHGLMYGRPMYFDVSKAHPVLGWRPRYSNDDMFIESFEWYLAHRDTVLSARGGSLHRSPARQGVMKLLRWIL